MIRPILGAVLALALLSSAAPGQGVGQGEVVAACAGRKNARGVTGAGADEQPDTRPKRRRDLPRPLRVRRKYDMRGPILTRPWRRLTRRATGWRKVELSWREKALRPQGDPSESQFCR